MLDLLPSGPVVVAVALFVGVFLGLVLGAFMARHDLREASALLAHSDAQASEGSRAAPSEPREEEKL